VKINPTATTTARLRLFFHLHRFCEVFCVFPVSAIRERGSTMSLESCKPGECAMRNGMCRVCGAVATTTWQQDFARMHKNAVFFKALLVMCLYSATYCRISLLLCARTHRESVGDSTTIRQAGPFMSRPGVVRSQTLVISSFPTFHAYDKLWRLEYLARFWERQHERAARRCVAGRRMRMSRFSANDTARIIGN
jgi:hypothetical protein